MKFGIDTSGSMTQPEIDEAVEVAKKCRKLARKKLLIRCFCIGVVVYLLLRNF